MLATPLVTTPSPTMAGPGLPTTTSIGSAPAPLEPPCPVVGTFTGQATVRQSRQTGSNTAGMPPPGC
jgi:hypothetical protein